MLVSHQYTSNYILSNVVPHHQEMLHLTLYVWLIWSVIVKWALDWNITIINCIIICIVRRYAPQPPCTASSDYY